MKIYCHLSTEVTESVTAAFTERPDLGVTILEIGVAGFAGGQPLTDCTLHFRGTPAERAAFLRRLAIAADAAAAAVDHAEPVLAGVTADA